MKFCIVDDDPDVLALIGFLIEGAGHSVRLFESSGRALTEIPAICPDCIITDVMMPGIDGLELTRELRKDERLAATKIVVLSAKAYEFDRRRAREMGADGYLNKPIQRDTFLAQVMELISDHIKVSYWGVHGTLPVPGPETVRYGGNTPCVSVEIPGEPIHIFDCGSGIRRLSAQLMRRGDDRLTGRIFISHAHWDHINTVPFFAPLYVRGNEFEVYGPHQGDLTIERAVSAQMEGVYFPVTIREFGAHVVFRDLREEGFDCGPVRIDTMLLSHPGYCLGYCITVRGRKVCYITDNELYNPGDPRRDERYVKRLADFVSGADVLITDTTYRDREYADHVDWGHSSVSQVAQLAALAQVKRLHLFHHDPDQTDADIDLKLRETRDRLDRLGAGAVQCESPAELSKLVI
jgi:phosphoribosyl 1,2-cyclic phosphodiesterase